MTNKSVSIIVPCLNEAGNIDSLLKRIPHFSPSIEIIFVDGGSTDGTVEKINNNLSLYSTPLSVRLLHQTTKGKGPAVRQAFAEANGDIFMILDADLSVKPEDLPFFYTVLTSGRADFANGCRLNSNMEKGAMQFLNLLANHFFSMLFSWLLQQPIKDTLCGTKALFKEDYQKIEKNRAYFGDFDPFGDFDLLFGAAKLNLKIENVSVDYQARKYGVTKIHRWRDGALLLKMAFIAFRKFKLS